MQNKLEHKKGVRNIKIETRIGADHISCHKLWLTKHKIWIVSTQVLYIDVINKGVITHLDDLDALQGQISNAGTSCTSWEGRLSSFKVSTFQNITYTHV